MKLKIYVDFNKISDYISDTSNPRYELNITNVTQVTNCVYSNVGRFYMVLDPSDALNIDCSIYDINNTLITYFTDIDEVGRIVDDTSDPYLIIDGEITFNSDIQRMIDLELIKIERFDNLTALYLYTQNDANNCLYKSLTLITIISGKFNHSIGVKALNIDVVNIPMNFNYVYIPSLSRYYFVDSIEIVSNDVRRLMLKEDVLMSWKSLIRQQSAFVDRQENIYDADIVDDLVTYSYDKFINTDVITLYTNIYENTGNDKLNFVIESVGG